MTKNNLFRLLTLSLLPIALAACGDTVKQTLGMERTAPDEFAVVERAPLTVPPEYNLVPPADGSEVVSTTTTTTKELVLGSESSAPRAASGSRAEQMLLQKTGQPDPGIRQQLATDKDVNEPETTAEKLGISSPAGNGKALDPVDEAQKLKKENIKTTPIKNAPAGDDAK